jgi:hypothetical protein
MIYGERGGEDFESAPSALALKGPHGGKIVALIRLGSVSLKPKISTPRHGLKGSPSGRLPGLAADF